MKVYIIGIMLIISTALFAQAPVVENVRFEQRMDGTLIVDIYYDVTDADSDSLEITIEASDDSGATWNVPCTSLTGDVGKDITPATNKHVVWDFYTDNPDTSGYSYRIRVTADDEYTMDVYSIEADIPLEGDTLQINDGNGNIITLTFPFAAVRDTPHVSLKMASVDMNLPIAIRQVPVFEIRPLDINLYRPAEITIEYNTPINETEPTALFRVRSENWLTPLSDHTYSSDKKSMTAHTLFFGDFAEGEMTYNQIKAQFDSLVAHYEVTYENYGKILSKKNNLNCDTKEHKKKWDHYRDGMEACLKGFVMMYFYQILEGQEETLAEDVEWLCEYIASRGVQEILDMCIPDNLCDTNYKHTIATMTRDMMVLGCEDSPAYPALYERFNQILLDCASYLTIVSTLAIEGGELEIMSIGYTTLNMFACGENELTVQGWGALDVSGDGTYGVCDATVSGVTAVEVFGTSNTDTHSYELTITTDQNAILYVQCGDLGSETALCGTGTYNSELNPDNGYSEEISNGDFSMTITLKNPVTSLPE